jgi:hypothetical protein
VAKSGRDSTWDIQDRPAERRRGRRIRTRVGIAVMSIAAVVTAIFAVTGSVALFGDHSRQSAYDKAPNCASGATQTNDCVLRTNAKVARVEVSKNTGKNAHGYTTRVELDPDVGRYQTVALSTSQDLSFSTHEGDRLPVLVWRDRITRFTYDGSERDADENPHHIVAVDLTQISLCLFGAAFFGRPVVRWALRARIALNRKFNRIPDWTLVLLVVTTPIAAILRASTVVSVLGLAGIAVLLGSALWPFLPSGATSTPSTR